MNDNPVATARRPAPRRGLRLPDWLRGLWTVAGRTPGPDAPVADEPASGARGALTDRAHTGLWGEQVAERLLLGKGCRIAARRLRIGRDEIDLVAVTTRGRCPVLVFVEVKTRRDRRFGGPIAAVDRRKRHVLCRAAARYLRHFPPPTPPFRFDVIEVVGTPADGDPEVRHVENAFPMEPRYLFGWLARGRPRAGGRTTSRPDGRSNRA